MKLVISPAKSLNFDTNIPTNQSSNSLFLEQSAIINKTLKTKSAQELSSLMKISDNLGELNYTRNQNWQTPFTTTNARQAVYAFNGDVYKGLDAYTIPEENIDTLQSTVRILSGLYGILKPLDLIQPYRLEMGTKLPIESSKNLYAFWKNTITTALNDELKDDELFLNLASNEYFKAIDTKALKVPVITANFKDFKNGVYKVISFHAKHARGAMARYIINTNANSIDDLKGFDYGGYGFSEELSSGNELIFTR